MRKRTVIDHSKLRTRLARLSIQARVARRMKDILDYSFDKRHGTNTAGIIPLEKLRIESPRKELGEFYAPVPGYEFRKLVRYLKIRPEKYTFIDFGCGKGRALLYAFDHNFRRVIGIEFSDSLSKIAVKNIAKYRRGHAEVILGDAADFVVPNEPCALYFANPFSDIVTREILSGVYNAYRSGNHDIYIIWYNVTSNARPLFEAPWLKLLAGEATWNPSLRDGRTLLQMAEFSLPFSIFKTCGHDLPPIKWTPD
jgi:SAM-dependent methyltransferase